MNLRELKYWWNCKTSGLEDLIDDVRDLHIRDLFGKEKYTPKHTRHLLAPIFEKDQLNKENCSFQAGSRACSIYWGENISARWLTFVAWIKGLCAKYGSAQLRNWAKIAQKYGVIFEKDLPSNENLSWEEYVNLSFDDKTLLGSLKELAQQNKIGSYWRIDTTDELLQCLDKGYAVVVGRQWRTSYNQGGGFSEPWIITKELKAKGMSVGGHATCVMGYDLDYHGHKVTIEKNSYSDQWGDKGFFHCDFDVLQEDIDRYGAFAITPIAYTPKEIKLSLLEQALKLAAQLLETLKKKK